MRNRIMTTLSAIILPVLFIAGPASAEDPIAPPVLVISHATSAMDAPMNTLAGIRLADDLGATYVEMDVRWSKGDGTVGYPGWPVLSHDDNLATKTNCTGSVANTGLTAVLACYANDYAPWLGNPTFANEKVSYAYDFFNVTRQEGLKPLLDVKVTPNRVQMDKLMYYATMFPGLTEEIIYMGSAGNIATVKPWYPNLEYMLIEYPTQGFTRTPASLAAMGVDHYALPWSYCDPDTIAWYHSKGIKVFVWTSDRVEYDTSANMQALLSAGADGIITNQADTLLGLL